MSGLSNRLKDVTPPSSSGSGVSDPSGPGPDNSHGTGNEGDRTLENVSREAQRRIEASEARLMGRIDEMANMVTGLIQNAGAPGGNGGTPASGGEEYSLEHLQQLRAKATDPEDLAVIDREILKAETRQVTLDAINQQRAADDYERVEREANELAVQRYPELHNSGSDMAMEVQKRLSAMSPNDQNRAGIILEVANEVAIQLGKVPGSGSSGNPARQSSFASGRSKPAPTGGTSDKEGLLSNEEFDAVASRLRYGMRGAQFSDDSIKSVKQKQGEVKDILDEHGPEAFRG